MTNPNDPASPTDSNVGCIAEHPKRASGLTKREWFAGLALSGMIAGSQGLRITIEQFAKQSISLADALIQELNK